MPVLWVNLAGTLPWSSAAGWAQISFIIAFFVAATAGKRYPAWLRMPGLDGLEATRQIAADPQLAGVRIVILTTFGLDEYLFDALRFGASGFLLKDTEPADLATAVRVVARGDSLISPSMTRRLVAEFARRAKAPHPAAELDAVTQREREVMTLVAGGLTNDEIARKLYMSAAAVRTHVSRAMTKLGVRDRAQLVVLAYETGLVRPNWLA